MHLGEPLTGTFMTVNPGRAEENYGVLDLFAAEARKRLAVFGQQAQNSSVRTVKKLLILICEWGWLQFFISHKVRRSSGKSLTTGYTGYTERTAFLRVLCVPCGSRVRWKKSKPPPPLLFETTRQLSSKGCYSFPFPILDRFPEANPDI